MVFGFIKDSVGAGIRCFLKGMGRRGEGLGMGLKLEIVDSIMKFSFY